MNSSDERPVSGWLIERRRKLALVSALIERSDPRGDADARLAQDHPDTCAETRQGAAFHLYTDGIGALLDVLAAAEVHLRGETDMPDGALVHHALHHLYGYQVCSALLLAPLRGALEDVRKALTCLSDGDPPDLAGARNTLRKLEQRLAGDEPPPTVP